jgi:hypothetical protein
MLLFQVIALSPVFDWSGLYYKCTTIAKKNTSGSKWHHAIAAAVLPLAPCNGTMTIAPHAYTLPAPAAFCLVDDWAVADLELRTAIASVHWKV